MGSARFLPDRVLTRNLYGNWITFPAKLSREPKKSWLKKHKKGRDDEEEPDDRTAITAFLTIDHLDEVLLRLFCFVIFEGGL